MVKPACNVLNPEDCDRYCRELAKSAPAHVAAWITSTFRRWCLNEYTVWCVNQADVDLCTQAGVVWTTARYANKYRVQNVAQQPAWVQIGLAAGTLRCWYLPDGAKQEVHRHWRDYLQTRPTRTVAMTVEQVKAAMVLWDRELEQQTLKDLTKGVEHVPVKVLDQEGKYRLFKLIDKEAFEAEGAAQKHCVGAYFDSDLGSSGPFIRCQVFSLREQATGLPVVTLEVRPPVNL